MNKRTTILVAFVALLSNSNQITASDHLTEHTLKLESGADGAKAELKEFEFLQGAWQGSGFDADCDEMWSAPSGSCMVGTFRMVKNDQLQFSEFCMIQRDSDGRVTLLLKHFTPNFVGWEKKEGYVSFPLVKVEQRAAYFAGLTYALQTDGSLRIWVAIENQDGKTQEAALHLQRTK